MTTSVFDIPSDIEIGRLPTIDTAMSIGVLQPKSRAREQLGRAAYCMISLI